MKLMTENNTCAKYYRILDDNSVDMIRLIRIKDTEKAIVIKESTKEKISISKEEFDKYTKLKPDGYISICKVELDNDIKDVIVSLHRRSDIADNDNVPYAVCRQNIFDLYTNTLKNPEDINTYVGCSVSRDTIPNDISFNMMLACNKILYMRIVCIYIDDNIYDVLNLINMDKFDQTLLNLYNLPKQPNVKGYCKDVLDLLIENRFEDDFYEAFDITKVKFEMDDIEGHLDQDEKTYFEDLLKVELLATYVTKYTKLINLKEIKRDYILVSDSCNDLYIVGYDKGNKINRAYDKLEDKRDLKLMQDITKE